MNLGAFARFLRPATLFAPVAGVIGGAVAASGGWPGRWEQPLWAVLSALLLTGYSNGINQIADIETDRINRPDRPLPAGTISAGAAWTATIALCAAAIGVGALVNAAFLGCVIVTVPVTTIYSLPPRLKRYPFLANAAIATPRGMGVVLAGWASGNGFFRVDAWVLSAVAWIYIFGASVTKDFADVEGDRATGCSTLPILWGAAAAARFVAPFLVVPFLLYPAAALLGWLQGSDLAWLAAGTTLALVGLRAACLLRRDPTPPADGRPHPAWMLMYLQYAASHLLTAAVYLLPGPPGGR